MRLERIQTRRGAMIRDADLGEVAGPDAFEAATWADRETGRAQGRGTVLFVQAEGEEWAIRHYLRGGLMRHINRDRYFWSEEDLVRSFRELRLLRDLHNAGLPVPRPVAARYVRRGLIYRQDLITVRLDGVRSLADRLGEDLAPDTWRKIGRTIHQLHRTGVDHVDLNAHNILLDAADRVWLIDFDRARRRAAALRWQRACLNRLMRSIRKVAGGVDAAGWSALQEGYFDR